MKIKKAPASSLPELLNANQHVIDVRTPAEFRTEHVSGAELLPLDRLNAADFTQSHGAKTPVYILCQSGGRATKAAQSLLEAGHEDVTVIEGGTNAAKESGVALERGKSCISLERQVRIAAGSLVFLGTVLGIVIHGGFLVIPAFVGAGLVFAGITDTCGMGMMLAKCPWNR